jgi:hypothetical protein
LVWKETLMALTTDWGYSKMQESEKNQFNCGFISRLNERCWLFYKDPKWLFTHLFQHFSERFPRHFIFANFQCLRCGQCCDDERSVYKEDIKRWIIDLRFDILQHVDCFDKGWCADHINLEPCEDCDNAGKEIVGIYDGRCPFVRKVRNKPYYECRIHDTETEECSGYLCEKSLPVAHLNWFDVDDLIQRIGLERYRSLTKKKQL